MRISNIIFGIVLFGLILLTSCVNIPKNVEAVSSFEKEKYLGKWYEIARLDNRFEKNLNNTTAFYGVNENGTIKVVNKGYNFVKKEWDSAQAVAKFVNNDTEGRLKVSFFRPFYAGYNIVAIDKDYQYALIYGNSTQYMWILSRNTKIDSITKEQFLKKAQQDGFDTSKLIWVTHNEN